MSDLFVGFCQSVLRDAQLCPDPDEFLATSRQCPTVTLVLLGNLTNSGIYLFGLPQSKLPDGLLLLINLQQCLAANHFQFLGKVLLEGCLSLGLVPFFLELLDQSVLFPDDLLLIFELGRCHDSRGFRALNLLLRFRFLSSGAKSMLLPVLLL